MGEARVFTADKQAVFLGALARHGRIAWALEEAGLPYERVLIDHEVKNSADYRRWQPFGQVPAFDDGKVSLFESGAILQYLGRKTGRFYPADERARVAVDEWLFWQCAGFGPMLGQTHHFKIYAKEKIPYAIERFTAETNRLYGVLDRRLADREYLAGEETRRFMDWMYPPTPGGEKTRFVVG